MDVNSTTVGLQPEWLTTSSTLAVTLLTFFVYYISSIVTDPLRKLPGPSLLPIIGSIHHLDKAKPHMALTNLAKIHGPVFCIKIFRDPFVVISSFDLVWDVLVKRSHEFSGRTSSTRVDLCLGEDVFSQEGEVHTLRKKLLMKVMRSYGSGLVEMENLLSRANEAFLSHLDKNEGKTINIAELLGDYVCTVTTVLMYGEEFDFEDPAVAEVKLLTKTVLEYCSPTNSGSEIESFPFLRKVPYVKDKYLNAEENVINMKKESIGKRSAHYQKNFELNKNENRGLLYQIIDAMKHDLNDDGSPKYPEEFLEGIIMDLLLGAIETTRRTTTQILLELCKQPQIAIRLQQEIDTVIGRDRQPKLSDKKSMHFTEAVVEEAQRLLTLLPFLLHKTIQDVELGGYFIPKNTNLFVNVWQVQHDADVYIDPFKFNPDRFLDENGHLLPHDHPIRKSSMPFGAGRRVCPGEVFAKSRLFLLLTTMLQNFDFTLCDDSIDCDVRSYSNEVVLEVPEQVPMIFTHRK